MLKILLVFFLFFPFMVSAQPGVIDRKVSPDSDPEVLLHWKDSLNLLDVTKPGMNLAEYYNMQYSVEMKLYHFDQKEEHLVNCIKWCNNQYAQDTNTIEPLIRGMETCKNLKNNYFAEKYYRILRTKVTVEELNADQIRRIDASLRTLHSDVIDGNYLLRDACKIDTLVKTHLNTTIDLKVQKGKMYKLVAGADHYLELKINTKECRCRDCSYCSTIFIQLPEEKLPVSMQLDSTNCFYSTTNTWIYEPKETISFGKFYQNETGLYLVLAYKNNPSDEIYMLQTYWISPEKLNGL